MNETLEKRRPFIGKDVHLGTVALESVSIPLILQSVSVVYVGAPNNPAA